MLARRLRREFPNISDSDILNRRVNFTHKGHDIHAVVHSDYPFKPPILFCIDGVEMNHAYFYSRPTPSKCCLMCQSFLCPDNWSPSLTLQKIAEQMVDFRNRVRQGKYNTYLRHANILPFAPELLETILDYL
jgi:hypothetical protein